MILSNQSLFEALDSGRLVIRPEPGPRLSDETHRSPFQTTAVDLRLGDTISRFAPGLAFNIDLRRGSFSSMFAANSTSVTLTQEQPYALEPGKFVLGRTLEWIELPIQADRPCLAARVEGRSSYARCGLLVHFTAPTIHAGFRGFVTLELINLGPVPILLYPSAPICQLIVESVAGQPFRNDSQFQGQKVPGGNA